MLISTCNIDKETCDKFFVIYEGTREVWIYRIIVLVHDYEMIIMLPH